MKYLFSLIPFALIFCSACGYHFNEGNKIAISVPYVLGDYEGEMTDALIRAISHTDRFRYTNEMGEWILYAKVVDCHTDRIGFRYDRDPLSGKLRENIVGVENRTKISLEVSVENSQTGECIIGPNVIKADADYDYFDPNSLQDVSFFNPFTDKRVTSIAFSLGQLDSVGAAGQDAIYPIYHQLAQKVVDGLIALGDLDEN